MGSDEQFKGEGSPFLCWPAMTEAMEEIWDWFLFHLPGSFKTPYFKASKKSMVDKNAKSHNFLA